jgi:hypothetical protein
LNNACTRAKLLDFEIMGITEVGGIKRISGKLFYANWNVYIRKKASEGQKL